MYSAILLGDFRRIELILFSGIMDVSFSCEAANPALPFIGRLSAATSAVPQLTVNIFRCQRIDLPLPATKQAPARFFSACDWAAVVAIDRLGRLRGA